MQTGHSNRFSVVLSGVRGIRRFDEPVAQLTMEGDGEVLQRTRTMVFAQALVTADGAPALRTSGIFRYRPPQDDAPLDFDPLGLRAG